MKKDQKKLKQMANKPNIDITIEFLIIYSMKTTKMKQ